MCLVSIAHPNTTSFYSIFTKQKLQGNVLHCNCLLFSLLRRNQILFTFRWKNVWVKSSLPTSSYRVALYNKLNKLVNVCTKTYLAELLYMWSSLGLTHIKKNESASVDWGTLFCLNTLLAFTIPLHSHKKSASLKPKAQVYRQCTVEKLSICQLFLQRILTKVIIRASVYNLMLILSKGSKDRLMRSHRMPPKVRALQADMLVQPS